MSKREEITDVINDSAYEDPNFKAGLVLKFAKTTIKITKVDRKNKRAWGEHIKMYSINEGYSHYGHNIDNTDPTSVYCTDCEVEVSEAANELGETKVAERNEAETEKQHKKEILAGKKFRYELLRQDGTVKHFKAGKRKKFTELYKILNCTLLELIPAPYYSEAYNNHHTAIFADEEGRFHPENIRNPHFLVLPGDPDLGEPAEWDVVGNAIAEIEVK